MTKIRCAIYTRKSSEEGLEQGFNSLDAQREACAAYVLSQASEGWNLLPDIYDDGGISGGTLERPALQRLLADVAAGKIDIIVVYKVDRLTRSLLDFSKLVEAFDKANTSFVSITQSFNTTTSMGRLTLNMLLSFAQFEREVTAERIRDKISASKAKGMWMGGTPPLGYKPDGRTLAIVEEHAELIRDLFTRYLELGNVRLLAEQLIADGIMTPQRTTGNGRAFGNCAFSRGQIYKILSNPIYIGDIAHQGKSYRGQHLPIIDRETWDQVQALLAGNVRGQRKVRRATVSLLAGRIVDEAGEPLVATHACKGAPGGGEGRKVRYRYYVSRNLHYDGTKPSNHGTRIAGREIEALVANELAGLLDDPIALFARAWIAMPPEHLHRMIAACQWAAAAARLRNAELLRALITQVRVLPDRVEIEVSVQGLANHLEQALVDGAPEHLTLCVKTRLTRTGMAVRLIQAGGNAATPSPVDLSLIKLLHKAQRWWGILAAGELSIAKLAETEGANSSYISRVVRLAFLAPDIVEAILDSGQRVGITAMAVTADNIVPDDWSAQRAEFLPASRTN